MAAVPHTPFFSAPSTMGCESSLHFSPRFYGIINKPLEKVQDGEKPHTPSLEVKVRITPASNWLSGLGQATPFFGLNFPPGTVHLTIHTWPVGGPRGVRGGWLGPSGAQQAVIVLACGDFSSQLARLIFTHLWGFLLPDKAPPRHHGSASHRTQFTEQSPCASTRLLAPRASQERGGGVGAPWHSVLLGV